MEVSFKLDGVPKSFGNLTHLHWRKLNAMKEPWRERARLIGSAARNEGGFDLAMPDDFHVVEVVQHRCYLMDRDNLAYSAKPIIDGLKLVMHWKKFGKRSVPIMGAGLIYDDDEAHSDITYRQVKVPHRADECVTITIRKEKRRGPQGQVL